MMVDHDGPTQATRDTSHIRHQVLKLLIREDSGPQGIENNGSDAETGTRDAGKVG